MDCSFSNLHFWWLNKLIHKLIWVSLVTFWCCGREAEMASWCCQPTERPGPPRSEKNKLVDNLCLFTHCVHQKQSFGKYQLTTTATLWNLTNKMVVPEAWKHGCSCCEQCSFFQIWCLGRKANLCNNWGLLFMLNFPN